MPSTSKSQQRLFSMAYAVRKGELSRSKVWKSVLDIVDGDMTDQQIKDFTVLKESLTAFIMESVEGDWTLKFDKRTVNKYDLTLETIKSIAHNFGADVTQPKGDGTPIILTFSGISSNTWGKFLDTIRDMAKEMLKRDIPYDALLKLGESGDHEEIYQVIRDEVK